MTIAGNSHFCLSGASNKVIFHSSLSWVSMFPQYLPGVPFSTAEMRLHGLSKGKNPNPQSMPSFHSLHYTTLFDWCILLHTSTMIFTVTYKNQSSYMWEKVYLTLINDVWSRIHLPRSTSKMHGIGNITSTFMQRTVMFLKNSTASSVKWKSSPPAFVLLFSYAVSFCQDHWLPLISQLYERREGVKDYSRKLRMETCEMLPWESLHLTQLVC